MKVFSQNALVCSVVAVASIALSTQAVAKKEVPADKFDLSEWNITLPLDKNKDKKPDQVKVKQIQKYAHPDFFYLDDDGYMTFASPNKALTTKNSTNTRSELRHMLRGKNTRIGTKAPANNFSVGSHPQAAQFGRIGGKLEATLKVNHVSKRAKYPEKAPAYSVVVGQIHAGKYPEPVAGFGWGNEPLKIYYKKWPEHEKGSVFWTYERNLAKKDPNRIDVAYPVWGNTWLNPEEPVEDGVELGEAFSYTVNVVGDIMYLTFEAEGRETVNYEINIANNVDAYGKVDEFDHKWGYLGDWMYFKAGAYNQCSTKDDPGFWYPACPGTGDWKEDKANGDYVSVSFMKLDVGKSKAPKKAKVAAK